MVPLTVIAMDRMAPAVIGNAASLFNLMRNLGGSIGIAVTETLLDRLRQRQINVLVCEMTPYDTETRGRLESITRHFTTGGSDPATAARQAHQAVWGIVQKQAAILSYGEVFRFLALLLLLAVPLVFLLERPAHGAGLAVSSGD